LRWRKRCVGKDNNLVAYFRLVHAV
jgi:hypothetical protein